jgi:hypothetical protein
LPLVFLDRSLQLSFASPQPVFGWPSCLVDDAAAFVSSGEGEQHAAAFPSSSGDGFYKWLSLFKSFASRGARHSIVRAVITL